MNKYDFTSIDNLDTDIIVDLDLLTICNLKCKYCIARHSYSSWNRLMSKTEIDKIIKALSLSVYELKITIVGGEPFLHPYLNYLLKKLTELNQVKKIWVFTNGTVYKEILDHEKIVISISYHLSNSLKKIIEFTNNIKTHKNVNLSILCYKLHNNIEHYKNVINTVRSIIPSVSIDLEPIVINHQLCDKNYLKSMIPFQNSDDAFILYGKNYNLIDIYEMIENHSLDLTDFNCIINRFRITVDGDIDCYCAENQHSNLFRDPYYFKNLKIQTVKCTESCNHKCVLDQNLGFPKFH